LSGVFLIEPELRADDRGFFARVWCHEELMAHGLDTRIAQCSVSLNYKRGTIRGMHFQAPPHAETKLVRCTRGAIFDVALDLRPESPTYCKWFAAELTCENRRSLYIPVGFVHGFQTLTDDAEVCYQISPAFVPEAARGVRWNDPAFAIDWPIREGIILSPRDASYVDYSKNGASLTHAADK
jgi:dTDP-4-dehydrorhamnose 3,5-epimerase